METQEALVELRKGLRVFKAFEQAEQAAVYLEGLEQNEKELNASLAKLKQEHLAATNAAAAELAALTARVATAEAQATQAEAEAGDAAAKLRAEAAKKASQLLAKSETALAALELKATAADLAAREAEVARDQAQRELAAIEVKIENAKSQIAKLLEA